MARLNELPGPAESIEALKRRFIRQNREIARVNSLQSLRIQGLETELSHLLKENAALKEQVISLQHDAEKYEAGRAFHKDIYQCKDKLAAKVAELNNLVNELGLLPANFQKKTAHLESAGESQRSSDPNRRPITWNDNDDRLPTILEDKYFPRRTLDPQELAEQQDIDSPSIGSPPVAHFDIHQSPLSRRHHDFLDTADALSSDAEDIAHSDRQSPEKSLNNTNDGLPILEQSVSPSKSASPPTLSGSKRKFSAAEEELTFSPLPVTNTGSIDDDFQFTRAVGSSRTHTQNMAVEVMNGPVSQAKQQPPKKAAASKRRALEPKTTNMASSVKKHGREAVQLVEDKPEKPTNKQGRDENSHNPEPAKKLSQSQSGTAKKAKRTVTAIIHEDEPVKPLVSTIPEPVESGCVQKKLFNADEPAVTDSMPLPGLGSRPSRRARGAISYAEPNLRDKMRRATNELVDAVIIAGGRRSSTTVTGTSGQEYDPDKSTLNNIPEENESSIDNKAATTTTQGIGELPKHMVTKRKRRTLSASTNDILRLDDPECGLDSKQDGQVHNSSAMLSPSADKSITTNNTTQAQTRRRSANPNSQSRRHSSNPAVSDREKPNLDDETFEIDSESHDDSLEDSFKHIEGTRAKTTRALTEESSILPAKRGQRVSARRRSMMV
ncbi:shugoshin family protein [Talaromyces stipitatus ATCC 10500]|uniref:Shugoshin family protein n=1 Tax=Talaromyces stipitatus (strain ATCC 10500 / CBS 375.48 / QM 6759 / NRRL 1006) TaxID=441959 RepID=B8M7A0_TALSN|nr:shugoshin family protein [Talaromyces stipitatus ATCC 10500]EED20320.1 shugoshin family protein [Talaromyces stipitatus ATCC 10500]